VTINEAYYYFTATLPYLDFDSIPPMPDEDFLNECERLLAEDDFSVVQGFLSQREKLNSHNDAVNALAQYNRDFRNEIVWFRTQKVHKDSGDAMRKTRAGSLSIVEAIQQASKIPNLLEAEKFLDKARWQHWDHFLMGLQGGLESIIVYGLKLKILNRYNEINSPKGSEIFEEIKRMEILV